MWEIALISDQGTYFFFISYLCFEKKRNFGK